MEFRVVAVVVVLELVSLVVEREPGRVRVLGACDVIGVVRRVARVKIPLAKSEPYELRRSNMQRIPVQPRTNWQATVESQGFHFHSIDDKPYWDDSVFYLFSREQVDKLE